MMCCVEQITRCGQFFGTVISQIVFVIRVENILLQTSLIFEYLYHCSEIDVQVVIIHNEKVNTMHSYKW